MQLRTYQHSAVKSLRDNIASGIKSQILCAPTGAGKSVIASFMVKAVYEKNKKALFLVDRRVLVKQFSQHLERTGIKHGVIMAKDPMYDPSQPIQVASCQTLEKYRYLGRYDVVFYDECVTGDVEILTENGFIRFDKLPKNIKVAQYDKGEISFVPPIAYIDKPYSGDLYHVFSDNLIDLSMTPGHEMLLTYKNGDRKEAVKDINFNGLKKIYAAGLGIGNETELTAYEKLMIALQADGTIHCGILQFSFSRLRKIDAFLQLMDEGGFRFDEVKCKTPEDHTLMRRFTVKGISAPSKSVETFFDISSLSSIKAKKIIDYMCNWDGSRLPNGGMYFSSINENVVDFYQSIGVLAGYKTNKFKQIDDRKDSFNDIYRITFYLKDNFGCRNIKKQKFEYKGNVYCVRVPSGNIVVRRNGKVAVIGNCHINRAIIKRIIEEMPGVTLIGLTATPLTQGLNKTYKAVVNVVTMANLVDEKFLVPFKVFIAQEIDVTGVKIISGEYAKDELEKRATLIVGDVVSDYLHISKTVWGCQKKTIVFCSGVDHGKQLCEAFNAIGKSFVDINYRHDDEYKAEVIAEFSKPDSSIDGLISCDILTRGFDIPDVEHIILARPLRKSLSMHIQMVGRGARISPDKNYCVIQCNSGNYLRFLEDFEEIYENGINELDDHKEKPKAEKTKKEKKDRTCPRCMALWPSNSNHCHSCGFIRPVTANIESVDGEIVELRGKSHKREFTGEQKQQIYWEFLGYARGNGYKDGWAYHKYTERFGVSPAWKKQYMKPSPETVAYIKHLNIKYHNKKYKQVRA